MPSGDVQKGVHGSVILGLPKAGESAITAVDRDMTRDGQLEAEQGKHAAAERFGLTQDQVEGEPQGQHPSGRRIGTLRLSVYTIRGGACQLGSAASLNQTLGL